jgi:hypothetical protein
MRRQAGDAPLVPPNMHERPSTAVIRQRPVSTRTSIMTGRPTHQNGLVMRRSWVRFPQAAPTFPQVRSIFIHQIGGNQAGSGMSSSCQMRRVAETRRCRPAWLQHPFVPAAAGRGDDRPRPVSWTALDDRAVRPDAGAIRRDQPADHHVSGPAGRLDYELVGARARGPGGTARRTPPP